MELLSPTAPFHYNACPPACHVFLLNSIREIHGKKCTFPMQRLKNRVLSAVPPFVLPPCCRFCDDVWSAYNFARLFIHHSGQVYPTVLITCFCQKASCVRHKCLLQIIVIQILPSVRPAVPSRALFILPSIPPRLLRYPIRQHTFF